MMALRAHARGGPEQLVCEQAPAARPGETLIAVHAAAITFAELTWDLEWTTRTVRTGRRSYRPMRCRAPWPASGRRRRRGGADELADRPAGGVLNPAADGQRGEHDREVGFDRVALVVVDGPGLQVVLGHPKRLFNRPPLMPVKQ